jgi:hypothetical protein
MEDQAISDQLERTERLADEVWKRARQFILLKQILFAIQLLGTFAVFLLIAYEPIHFTSFVDNRLLALIVCLVSILSQSLQVILGLDSRAEKYRLIATDIMRQMSDVKYRFYSEAPDQTDRLRTLRLLEDHIRERAFELDKHHLSA